MKRAKNSGLLICKFHNMLKRTLPLPRPCVTDKYGGAITLQGVTNKNIIRIEQPQQDKQQCVTDNIQSPIQHDGAGVRAMLNR
jgi:hypothetical protein